MSTHDTRRVGAPSEVASLDQSVSTAFRNVMVLLAAVIATFYVDRAFRVGFILFLPSEWQRNVVVTGLEFIQGVFGLGRNSGSLIFVVFTVGYYTLLFFVIFKTFQRIARWLRKPQPSGAES